MRTHDRNNALNHKQEHRPIRGEHANMQQHRKDSQQRQVLAALDLIWLNAQFPGSSWDIAQKSHVGLDTVREFSPVSKERRGTMKRELLEQGLVYCLGFVFVCAALPFLRYMS